MSIDPSAACDNCNQWFHKPCVNMDTIISEAYQDNSSMEWLCCSCSFPNVASKLFDTTNSSVSSVSSISQYTVRCKAKSLHILTANLQSLWSKKGEVEKFVLDNDMDIVIGSESHLHQGISTGEFLSYGYTAFRRDQTDG